MCKEARNEYKSCCRWVLINLFLRSFFSYTLSNNIYKGAGTDLAQKKNKSFLSKHKKNKKKKTYRPGKNKSSFQKNLELFGTVVLLALALVVFKNALSMNRNSVGKQNSFQTEEA